MPSLEELFGQLIDNSSAQAISKQLGSDENQTLTAIAAAIPSLMEAVSQNASTPDGARQLHAAVEKDHDGSLLDTLGSYVEQYGGSSASTAGGEILKHILGSKQKQVESGVSKISGLDTATVMKLMSMLAPVVMGAIGRQQKQKNLDADGLSKYLGQQRATYQKENPKQASFFEKMLDQDGDSDFDVNDMVNLGSSLVGQLLKS